MGYDRKYGKVTTEFGNIGDDEPVVVFRAQDRLLPFLLPIYVTLCYLAGSPKRHMEIVKNTHKTVMEWQQRNKEKVRTPTSESSRDRLED